MFVLSFKVLSKVGHFSIKAEYRHKLSFSSPTNTRPSFRVKKICEPKSQGHLGRARPYHHPLGSVNDVYVTTVPYLCLFRILIILDIQCIAKWDRYVSR